MKPALYYAILAGHLRSTGLDRVMIVTSEKGSQIYGRDYRHNNPTHRSYSDVVAKFPDEATVLKALSAVAEIEAIHDPGIQRARQELQQMERNKRKAIENIVQDHEIKARGEATPPRIG